MGVPGEPFCQHAVRLRQRAYLPTVLVFGYCNGHLLYFPTIEAASEGGYGADPQVSPDRPRRRRGDDEPGTHQHLPAGREIPRPAAAEPNAAAADPATVKPPTTATAR